MHLLQATRTAIAALRNPDVLFLNLPEPFTKDDADEIAASVAETRRRILRRK